jgi:hypothetical protein
MDLMAVDCRRIALAIGRVADKLGTYHDDGWRERNLQDAMELVSGVFNGVER